jgi:branched-chain amino acid transport system permease protein
VEAFAKIAFQIIVFGFLAGSVYSLFGLGLTLIMGVGKLLNISHGDLGIFGAYAAYVLFAGFAVDPMLSLIVVVPFIALVGMSVLKYVISPAIKDPKLRIMGSAMITYGLALFISNGELLVGPTKHLYVELPYSYSGFEILGTMINIPRLIVLISAAILAFVLIGLLRTRLGKAIRGSAQDPMLAELVGINCSRITITTFMISVSLASIAGVLYILNHPLFPTAGLSLTIKGLTVMVLGGIGNVFGALVGGLILGLAESSTSFFLGDMYREMIVYLVLITGLLIRPSGIFGSVDV